jgi:hypothetical protein
LFGILKTRDHGKKLVTMYIDKTFVNLRRGLVPEVPAPLPRIGDKQLDIVMMS